MKLLSKIRVKNYRCIGDLEFEPSGINVFFGPNGVGKTTFLDVIKFLKESKIRGKQYALSKREQGVNLLFDYFKQNEPFISISLETQDNCYTVTIGTSQGKIDYNYGETLYSKTNNTILMDKKLGESSITFHNDTLKDLRGNIDTSDNLVLSIYNNIGIEHSIELNEYIQIFDYSSFFISTEFNKSSIKRIGSETEQSIVLNETASNLISVLRNLKDKEYYDKKYYSDYCPRYKNILQYMTEVFPEFEDIIFEQSTPHSVYASVVLKNRVKPVFLSGISDGMLQMLILLTGIFYSEPEMKTMIFFDEPATSLHPWAIAVFAKAVKEASEKWNKQIYISTHSPVLISQFEDHELVECSLNENGSTQMKKLSDIEDVQDILEYYSAGTLYMTGDIGRQGAEIDD